MTKDMPVEAPKGAVTSEAAAAVLSREVNSISSIGRFASETKQTANVAGSFNLPDTRIVGNDGDLTPYVPLKSFDVYPNLGKTEPHVFPKIIFDYDSIADGIAKTGELTHEPAEILKKHLSRMNEFKNGEPDFSALSRINQMLENEDSPYRLQVKEDKSRENLAIAYPDRVWDLRIVDTRRGKTTDFENDFFRRSTRRVRPAEPWEQP